MKKPRRLRGSNKVSTRRESRFRLAPSDTVGIAQTAAQVVGSFRRNDSRIRKRIASKYGRRRRHRILHFTTQQNRSWPRHLNAGKPSFSRISKASEGSTIRVTVKDPGIGGRMNGWSFSEARRQLEYKARWVGIPVVGLSRIETRGTSVTCPQCGERLQEDRRLGRKLWCGRCRVMMDRGVVAAVNLSRRGRLRFDRSRAKQRAERWSSWSSQGQADAYGSPQSRCSEVSPRAHG